MILRPVLLACLLFVGGGAAVSCGKDQFCFALTDDQESSGLTNKPPFDAAIVIKGIKTKDGHEWTYDLKHHDISSGRLPYTVTLEFSSIDKTKKWMKIELEQKTRPESTVAVDYQAFVYWNTVNGDSEVNHSVRAAIKQKSTQNVTLVTEAEAGDAVGLNTDKLKVAGHANWVYNKHPMKLISPRSKAHHMFNYDTSSTHTTRASTAHEPALLAALIALIVIVVLMLVCIVYLCWRSRSRGPEITLLPDKTTPDLVTVDSGGVKVKSALKSKK